jgi:UDP-N-acetylmuramate dehydrogenase
MTTEHELGVQIERDVPLAPLTTLGIGGPARRLVRLEHGGLLSAILASAELSEQRILVLGSGSNLVVSDAGWDGLVLQMALRGVNVDLTDDHALVWPRAGVVWDDFVAAAVDDRLAGIECLSGIPGLVGATPMQNVGAYGQEVSDTVVLVRAYDLVQKQVVTFDPADCRFGYRSSRFRGSDRWIILDVKFRLVRSELSMPIRYPELARALGIAEGARAPLRAVRDTVLALRRTKGMVVDPADPESRSAGSFFTNPIVDAATLAALDARFGAAMPRWPASGGTKLSAGWLIERAGFARGHTVGRVGISRKHALALVNRGGATASELLALARAIQDRVRAELGVELVPEPVIV